MALILMKQKNNDITSKTSKTFMGMPSETCKVHSQVFGKYNANRYGKSNANIEVE
jgi:hypothetical protein